MVEDGGFWKDDIFIDPPEDGEASEEDSGNEECNDINRLSGRQLAARATAKVTADGQSYEIGS